MGKLVGNGTRLYRRDNLLVRGPIYKTITLAPDDMAYYSVAQNYNNGYPTSGFIGTNRGSYLKNCVYAGKLMRRAYLGITSYSNMIWRHVTITAHEPEFVFYHGLMRPTAFDVVLGLNGQSESYMQIPAYHFTLPTGSYLDACSLTLLNGGDILYYGWPSVVYADDSRDSYDLPYLTHDCPQYSGDYERMPLDSDFREPWTMKLGVYQNLEKTPNEMHSDATQDAEIDTNGKLAGKTSDILAYYNQPSSGSGYWVRDIERRILWETTGVSYYDGSIPTVPSAQRWNTTIDFESATINKLNTNGGGWIVLTPDVSVSLSDDSDSNSDYPTYTSPHYNWWVCCSFWQFRLNMKIIVAD